MWALNLWVTARRTLRPGPCKRPKQSGSMGTCRHFSTRAMSAAAAADTWAGLHHGWLKRLATSGWGWRLQLRSWPPSGPPSMACGELAGCCESALQPHAGRELSSSPLPWSWWGFAAESQRAYGPGRLVACASSFSSCWLVWALQALQLMLTKCTLANLVGLRA